MKSVIIDICKYLLFVLIALGLVAALVGCGDDSNTSGNGGGPGFLPSSPAKLPDISQLNALVRVSDSRFPQVTTHAYQPIPAATYFASPNSYDLVCFVWNSARQATLQLMEIFVDFEGFEYHVQDPGYGRNQRYLNAFAELVPDYPRGIVPIFIVSVGGRLLLTADTYVADKYESFVAFYALHPAIPK